MPMTTTTYAGGWMEAEVAARRLIDSTRTWEHETLRLTALLTDIGIDLETMCLSDLTDILIALKTELGSGRHPSQLVEREAVFAMLRRQNRRIEFTGGLEARALEDYQVELLASLRPRPRMFFAYDPGDEFETLRSAASRLLEAGFTRASHCMRAYVLIGYPKDTFAAAEQRLRQMLAIGFTPMAMLWRPETPSQQKWAPEESWRTFQRLWARPAIIHAQDAIPRSPADRARAKAARAAQRADAADRANLRPPGRPKKNVSITQNDRNISRPVGTTRAAALRRLRKDRPDIHARVLAGELSPHAGMIEAGFRNRQPPLAGRSKP